MNLSLLLLCLWFVVANLIAMLPSRHHHWPAAYGLIAIGVPLLGYVTWQNGPIVGIVALAGGASVLRWPLIFLWRWLRRGAGRGGALGKSDG